MDVTGTLTISRSDVPDTHRPQYTIMLLEPGTSEATARVHRCTGDSTLLRVLEELLPQPEGRREALESLRATGHASITKASIGREQLKKYGLAL